MPTLPFPDYRPDLSDLDAQYTARILNVVPRADGYGPWNSLEALTDTLPAPCRGYFKARNPDGTIAIFAGTATDLYKLDNTTLTWVKESKSGGPYTALPQTGQWRFAQFNKFVIAVQANVDPQVWVLGTSTDFDDLGGSPPQAAEVSIVGRFVVLSHLTSNPNRVQWSGLNDPEEWTAGVNSSDFQDLPDGGIARTVVGGEFGIILQDNAIRRMTFSPGSETIFDIQRIAQDVGIRAPYSVAVAGERAFFLSNKGFMEASGTGLPLPIGEEKVNRTFLADWDADAPQYMIGAASPRRNIVVFAYKSQSNSGDYFDKALVYNYLMQRWSPLAITGQYITTAGAPGLTLEGLDAIAPGALTITGAAAAGASSSHVLFVRFDGSDAATSAADASASNHTLTFGGDAQLDTADKKFGTASLLLDGDDYVSIADSADWNFGSGDFTIHAWVKPSSITSFPLLLAQTNHTDDISWNLFFGNSGGTVNAIGFSVTTDGTSGTAAVIASANNAVSTGTWQHVAATRSGNTLYLFVDGVLVGSTAFSGTIFDSSQPLLIGGSFVGWIDQVEIIKGVALWTEDFTPPTSPDRIRIEVADTSDLTTGDYKTISGVTGTTEANDTWPIEVIDATHFDLVGSMFANAYSSGGLIAGSLDAMEGTLDDISAYASDELSACNTDGAIGFFSGSPLEATLETAEQSGDGRRMQVQGFTPLTDAPEAYGSLGMRDRINDVPSYTSEVPMDTWRGFCAMLWDTRYARGRIRIPAGTNWTYATGVRPEFALTGAA